MMALKKEVCYDMDFDLLSLPAFNGMAAISCTVKLCRIISAPLVYIAGTLCRVRDGTAVVRLYMCADQCCSNSSWCLHAGDWQIRQLLVHARNHLQGAMRNMKDQALHVCMSAVWEAQQCKAAAERDVANAQAAAERDVAVAKQELANAQVAAERDMAVLKATAAERDTRVVLGRSTVTSRFYTCHAWLNWTYHSVEFITIMFINTSYRCITTSSYPRG